jgi:ABC-type nitrate/sulfonate/bicarbonate transport system permease component
MTHDAHTRVVQRLLVPTLLIAIWTILAHGARIDPLFVPPPEAVGRSLWRGLVHGHLLSHLAATTWRALAGFAIATVIGAPLGLLIGRSRIAARMLDPTVDVLRAIPPTALLPLFTLLFALGDATKLALVAYGCAFVVLVNAAYGARQVSTVRLDAMRLLGLSPMQRWRWVILPEAAPQLLAGVRVGLSLALMLVVVAEMFAGTTRGLGQAIAEAGNRYAMAECWAAILLTGVLGWALSRIVLKVERRVLHWVGR